MAAPPLYARVVVDVPARALNRLLTYQIPPPFRESLEVGCVVLAPLATRQVSGVVVELLQQLSPQEEKLQLRPLTQVLEATPFWGGELLALIQIMRRLYACTWQSTFQAVVPAPVLRRLQAMWQKKRVLNRKRRRQAEAPALYSELPLTSAQEAAVQAIIDFAATGKPVLLYGVTGSGKTEVYLRAVQHFLQAGKQAIVLVPELSLTPQAVERYRGRLGERVGILHSALSAPERRDYWWAMRRGELPVALGTRSAIFAPFTNLGLICIDEEHESSYKQEQEPRYHARQVAFMRAKEHGAALVLGSATPSVESFYLAQKGHYQLVELPQRPGGQSLPPVNLVDMRRSHNRGRLISCELEEALARRLERGEQAVLLLNRRGYASQLQCQNCGYIPLCPHCAIPLTWHKGKRLLLCHYCDYRAPLPSCCPQCRGVEFKYGTPGAERLALEIARLFPEVPLARMDRDTVGKIGAHAAILEAFGRGETRILLGTKMIAKGLDYPNVTLVGVLRADAELAQPDFRAGERTFQLLSQAAGRAGRGSKGGEVLMQAWDVDHPILQAVARHDYLAMYKAEIALRRELIYPPFCRLVRVVVRSLDPGLAQAAAQEGVQILRAQLAEGEYLVGPAPCALERLQGYYRWHFLLKSPQLLPSVQRCAQVSELLSKRYPQKVQAIFDPEPQNLS